MTSFFPHVYTSVRDRVPVASLIGSEQESMDREKRLYIEAASDHW